MNDIWFGEEDDAGCLACGDSIEKASRIPGLCMECAAIATEPTHNNAHTADNWTEWEYDEQ